MENNVETGVDWSILWNFRNEYYDNLLLGEMNGWEGVRKDKMFLTTKTGKPHEILLDNIKYKRFIKFNKIGEIYGNKIH